MLRLAETSFDDCLLMRLERLIFKPALSKSATGTVCNQLLPVASATKPVLLLGCVAEGGRQITSKVDRCPAN